MVSTDEVPNDDYGSLFDGAPGSTGTKRKREVEMGFANTALASGANIWSSSADPQPGSAGAGGEGDGGAEAGNGANGIAREAAM